MPKQKEAPIAIFVVSALLIVVVIILAYNSQYSIKDEVVADETPVEEKPVITPSEPVNPAEPVEVIVDEPIEDEPIEVEAIAEADEDKELVVQITRTGFTPKELVVNKGETVTWVNSGSTPHGVSAKDKSFFIQRLYPGENYTYTFNEEGNFPYIDNIFINLQGKIIVE